MGIVHLNGINNQYASRDDKASAAGLEVLLGLLLLPLAIFVGCSDGEPTTGQKDAGPPKKDGKADLMQYPDQKIHFDFLQKGDIGGQADGLVPDTIAPDLAVADKAVSSPDMLVCQAVKANTVNLAPGAITQKDIPGVPNTKFVFSAGAKYSFNGAVKFPPCSELSGSITNKPEISSSLPLELYDGAVVGGLNLIAVPVLKLGYGDVLMKDSEVGSVVVENGNNVLFETVDFKPQSVSSTALEIKSALKPVKISGYSRFYDKYLCNGTSLAGAATMVSTGTAVVDAGNSKFNLLSVPGGCFDGTRKLIDDNCKDKSGNYKPSCKGMTGTPSGLTTIKGKADLQNTGTI